MFKPHKVALSVGTALALAYAGISTAAPLAPAVVADAYLLVDNFTILKGFTAGSSAKDGTDFTFCLGGTSCGAELNISQLNATSQISGTHTVGTDFIKAFPAGNTVAFPISHSHSTDGTYQTPSASTGSYVLYTAIGGGAVPVLNSQPTANYSAAAADASGNSLVKTEGSINKTHAQTSINTYGNVQGTGHSDLGLTVTVTFSIGATTDFEFNFDAESYLRAALGQFSNAAQASTDWTLTINEIVGTAQQTRVLWNPNGTAGNGFICGGGAVCVEEASAFGLDDTHSAASQIGGDDIVTVNPNGVFELDVTLSAGTYQLTIFHQVNTSGSINENLVPEPGTMALLGLGLLGLGVTARRRISV